jgi:hypothetical protein
MNVSHVGKEMPSRVVDVHGKDMNALEHLENTAHGGSLSRLSFLVGNSGVWCITEQKTSLRVIFHK